MMLEILSDVPMSESSELFAGIYDASYHTIDSFQYRLLSIFLLEEYSSVLVIIGRLLIISNNMCLWDGRVYFWLRDPLVASVQ